MNFADTLRGLWRRWYIVIPGLLISASLAVGAYFAIDPGYERSSVQLLIPGADSMPEGANPFLFLGGLSPAADVLVRAVGSKNVLNEVVVEHPGVDIAISRDTTTAGPVVLIVVTAASDAAAADVLGLLVDRTATTLDDLQKAENIPAKNRVTVLPLTVDTQSILQQRSRLLGTAGVGLGGVVLTLLLAGLVEGVSVKRRQRKTAKVSAGTVMDPLPGFPVESGAASPARAAYEPSPRSDQSDYGDEPASAASAVHSAQ